MTNELLARIKQRADNPATRIDNCDTGIPPCFPPATAVDLALAERSLGFSLPLFLGEVYVGVGNGGFGPGYGLIGLPGGFTDDRGQSIVELYQLYHEATPDDPNWEWPGRLVPICHWGCAIYSCVDCDTRGVVSFDPGEQADGEPLNLAFAQSHSSIEAWFEDWVRGVKLWDKMYVRVPGDDLQITNPFTRETVIFPKRRLRR